MPRGFRVFAVALLTIAGLVGSTVPLRADDDDRRERNERCERRVHQAEERLRDAIQRHGEESRQAHRRHEQLEEVRRRCGYDRDRDHRDHDEHFDHDQH